MERTTDHEESGAGDGRWVDSTRGELARRVEVEDAGGGRWIDSTSSTGSELAKRDEVAEDAGGGR